MRNIYYVYQTNLLCTYFIENVHFEKVIFVVNIKLKNLRKK